MIVYIYALVDPDTQATCYAGQTDNLRRRLTAHMTPSHLASAIRRDTPERAKAEWLLSLREQGKRPTMAVLETVEGKREADIRESWWIAELRRRGEPLLNTAHSPTYTRQLTAYTDPNAPERQGRRLVRRSDIKTQSNQQ